MIEKVGPPFSSVTQKSTGASRGGMFVKPSHLIARLLSLLFHPTPAAISGPRSLNWAGLMYSEERFYLKRWNLACGAYFANSKLLGFANHPPRILVSAIVGIRQLISRRAERDEHLG